MDKSTVRFVYFRNSNKHPAGVMAYQVYRSENLVRYEYSAFNPLDNFDRKRGRAIALARLDKHPRKFTFSDSCAKLSDIVDNLFAVVLDSPDCPSIIRKAIKQRNLFHEKRQVVRELLTHELDNSGKPNINKLAERLLSVL